MNPWVLLAGLLIVASAAGGGYYYGYEHAELWWVAEDSKRAAERAEAAIKESEKARAAEQAFSAEIEQQRTTYENRLRTSSAALSDALGRLRSADRVSARQPAETSPAVCLDHDAAPSQLSMSDREILLRLAGRADEAVEQLTTAQHYIAAMRQALELEPLAAVQDAGDVAE